MFAERLTELRKEKGLTQDELGKILGFRDSTISQYETGKRKPDQETLTKIADYFDVTTDYLLGRSDIRKPEIYNDPEIVSLARARQKMTPEQLERWKRINKEIFPEAFSDDNN